MNSTLTASPRTQKVTITKLKAQTLNSTASNPCRQNVMVFGNNKVLTVEAASLPVMRNFQQKNIKSIIHDAIAATLLTALALAVCSKQNPYDIDTVDINRYIGMY